MSTNIQPAREAPPARLVTVQETSAIMRVSRSRVYELFADGRLPSVKIGRSRRVSVAAIDEFIQGLGNAEGAA